MAIQAKVGDVVHVRGTLVADAPHPCVRFWEMDAIEIPMESIVHVEPQPLKVGDRVRSKDGASICGPIIAIDKAHAWVKPVSAGFGFIVELDRLDRADEPRPLKVGDKVRHKEGWFGTIVGINHIEGDHQPEAIVRRGDATRHAVHTSNLELVE